MPVSWPPPEGIWIAGLTQVPPYVDLRCLYGPVPQCRPDLNGVTILVVEDDHDSLDVLEMFLRSCGPQVLTASNASAAIAYVETAPKLDAVLTDIAMPEIDGAALAAPIRRHPTRSRPPIIAISADQENYGNRAEFDAYLRKPVDIYEVYAVTGLHT